MAINTLSELIFYAIDKASPFSLSTNPADDTLDKISDLTLAELSITNPGMAIMWTTINGSSWQYNAKPVAASIAAKADTVDKVKKAVFATIGT